MKVSKKFLWLSPAVFTALLLAAPLLGSGHVFAAATKEKLADIQKCANTLRFANISLIRCTDNSGNDINFHNNDPYDTSTSASVTTWVPEDGFFCNAGDQGSFKYGVTINPPSAGSPVSIFGMTNSSGVFSAALVVGYDSGSGCTKPPGNSGKGLYINNNVASVSLASYAFAWKSDGSQTITSVSSVTAGDLSNLSFDRAQDTSMDPGNGKYLYLNNVQVSSSDCSGQIMAVSLPKGAVSASSTEYTLGSSDGVATSTIDDLKNFAPSDSCVATQNFGFKTSDDKALASFLLDGNTPSNYSDKGTATIGGDSTSATSNENNASCVFAGGGGLDLKTSLNWIICPILSGVSSLADSINGFVSAQLNFSITDNLTGKDSNVQRAWAIFKDLASVMIVLLLLVMVIGQAIGSGPFDAYTVKKLLPKLVIAVILMQISWYMCIWFIQLANDFGQGIAHLMAAPFGGVSALDLPSLLHRLSPTFAAVSGAASISVIIASPILIYFFWPGILMILFALVMNLLIALLTLLFRNALIIILVISSPIALLLWATPGGTAQGWWKKWYENFSKVLIFFPLVMAMIYGGRIFAWVAGNLGGAGPFDMIMVLVGFFGPYFFLPKTFKMGGSYLSQAASAISDNQAMKKTREGGMKILKERDQSWRGKLARDMYDPRSNSPMLKYIPKKMVAQPEREADGSIKRDPTTGKIVFQKNKLGMRKFSGMSALDKHNLELEKAGVAMVKHDRSGQMIPSRTGRGQYKDKNGNVVSNAEIDRLDQKHLKALSKAGAKLITDAATGQVRPVINRNGEYVDASNKPIDVKLGGKGRFIGIPSIEGRLAARIAARQFMPTARGRALTIQLGAKYAEERNSEQAAYVERARQFANDNGYTTYRYEKNKDGTVKLNAAGNPVIQKVVMPAGVAAQKQILVDLAGLDPSKDFEGRIAKAAQLALQRTHSNPEIEDAMIGDINSPYFGKHVWQAKESWKAISTSDEFYPAVIKDQGDLAPDVLESKESKAEGDVGRLVKWFGQRASDDRIVGSKEGPFKRVTETLTEVLSKKSEHETKAATALAAGNTALAAEEKRNAESYGKQAASLASTVMSRFAHMAESGEEGTKLLHHLSGGQVEQTVNKMLASVTEAISQGQSVLSSLDPDTAKKLNDVIGRRAFSEAAAHGGKIDMHLLMDVAREVNRENISPRQQAATVESQSVIKIQHEKAAETILPPPATLSNPADMGMFMLQLKSNPQVLQTLINNIAYGSAKPEYLTALQNLKTDFENKSKDPALSLDQQNQAKDEWNRVVAQMQAAITKRLDDEVAHAISKGVDAATARAAAMQAPDPVTGRTYAEEIQELQSTGSSPLNML